MGPLTVNQLARFLGNKVFSVSVVLSDCLLDNKTMLTTFFCWVFASLRGVVCSKSECREGLLSNVYGSNPDTLL